ncbi:MAG: ChaN family lipoprotein [Thermoguttaceae bacterium]
MRQNLLCLIGMTGAGVITAAAFAEEPPKARALLQATSPLAGKRADAEHASLWIDVYQGEPVQYQEVLEDLATARNIYLGERHTLQRHHEMQTKILTDLAQKGLPLALGLEQMESSQQSHLDRYNRGEIDFEQLARVTTWPKRWQNYQQYRPILEAARKWRVPVVALNAKSETIRQVVRSGGIDRLAPEARKELPAKMQMQDPPYEKSLSLQMMVHASATPQTLRPMIEAQIARDEAMAEALATFLESQQGQGRKMLVLCGAGHVAYGLGLPTRVRRRLPDVKDRIVLFSESGDVRLSPEEKAQARAIEITHEQLRELRQPIADYLWVKPLEENPAR